MNSPLITRIRFFRTTNHRDSYYVTTWTGGGKTWDAVVYPNRNNEGGNE